MRRPRGKPKVAPEVQAREVVAYALRICQARGPVQKAAREALQMTVHELARRTKLAPQSIHDAEKEEGTDSCLFMLAAVGRVLCGSFSRFARDIEKAAGKGRQVFATAAKGRRQAS